MIKDKKMRNGSNSHSVVLIVPAVIFLVVGMAFVILPQAFATTINVTREISAPANQI